MKTVRSLVLWWLAASVLLVAAARSQTNTPPPFSAEELDALVAPIALYPDSLLSQVLMASTYPLEVVQAARWAKANPDAKGDAALKKVENESWDVSVKSLTAFPNILEMMNEKLDWTQKLGDAFLAQQKDVLASVQRLRRLAQNAGNLQSNEQQVVRSEQQVIIIEPAQPQVIYVPAYNPTVVYGAWPYPAYPPYYYPGVAAWYPGSALVRGFAWGVGFAAAGAIFGNCNWGRGDVNINVNRATNIDRNYTRNNVNAGNTWQHNAQHRGNTPYRDQASRERYDNRQANAARQEFRGRDGAGSGASSEGLGGDRGGQGGRGQNAGGGSPERDFERGNMSNRGSGAADRDSRASAFDGVNSGARDLDRGRASTGQMDRQAGNRGGGGAATRQAGGGGQHMGAAGGGRSAGGGGRAGGGGGGRGRR